MSSPSRSELISHWFAQTLDDPATIKGRMGWWFSADEERDRIMADHFGGLVGECATGLLYHWLDNPEGRLAMIIALDQLPRNLFRGTPRAFSYDSYTAALCLAAAHTGQDMALKPIQRAFFYMPLQHFEDLQAQEAGVQLYELLAEENPEWPVFAEGFTAFARLHRDIISRFGRFPHRNKVLNRESTAEEAEYLAGDAPTFGQ
jgi:uncharacterized protein (DUF924 family)